MRIAAYRLWWIALFSLLGLFTACEDDPCANRNCQNGSICVDGDCDCPEGFVGINCEIRLDPCQRQDCHPTQSTDCLVGSDSSARCVCADGFEGDRCEALWTDKYVGTYDALENCTGTGVGFAMTVTSGPRFQQLTFENFHGQAGNGSTAKVVADLIQPEVISIPEQFMVFGAVSGGGSYLVDGGIQLTYQIIQDEDTLSCITILTPQ